MEKFKDIRVGDTVYVLKQVSTGLGSGKSFYIPKRVIKITDTQFTIEGGDIFKKDGGQKIGDYLEKCYKLGDYEEGDSNKTVFDQSQQYDEFKTIVSSVNTYQDRLNILASTCNYDISLDELKTLSIYIGGIEEILNKIEK